MVTITTQASAGQLEPGTTVTIMAPSAPPDFVQPTAAELRKLEGLVYRLRPDLDLRADRDFLGLKHTRELSAAFLALSWMGRRGEVDHGVDGLCARAAARRRHRGADPESYPDRRRARARRHTALSKRAWPRAPVHTGTPATNAWRTVLKSGAVRPASPEQATRGGFEPGRVVIGEGPRAPLG